MSRASMESSGALAVRYILNLIIAINKQKNWEEVKETVRNGRSVNMRYNAKVIVAGNVIELYEYEKEVRTGKDKDFEKPVGRKGKGKGLEWLDKEKNRADALQRAKKTLRRLINANVDAWGEKAKFFYANILGKCTRYKNVKL